MGRRFKTCHVSVNSGLKELVVQKRKLYYHSLDKQRASMNVKIRPG